MFGKSQVDPKAKQVAVQIGASRVAVGLAAALATRPALRAIGFPSPGPTGEALARLAGGRDIVLGSLTLAMRDDSARLRTVLLVSNLSDLADSAAFAAVAGNPEVRRAGIGGAISGGAAALAGFWAWHRLGDA